MTWFDRNPGVGGAPVPCALSLNFFGTDYDDVSTYLHSKT
jgi:hypothetical protein